MSCLEAYEVAKKYAKEYNVDINSVKQDEILSSRRYKYFKVIYSTQQNQPMDKSLDKSNVKENVWSWLQD